MRPRTLTALAAAGFSIAMPMAVATAATPRGEFDHGGILQLGTGSNTCTLKRGASCIAGPTWQGVTCAVHTLRRRICGRATSATPICVVPTLRVRCCTAWTSAARG